MIEKYTYFKIEDFDCQETGENKIEPQFIHKLDHLRKVCGFPFIVTSGYGIPNQSLEKRKETPGTHAQGIATKGTWFFSSKLKLSLTVT